MASQWPATLSAAARRSRAALAKSYEHEFFSPVRGRASSVARLWRPLLAVMAVAGVVVAAGLWIRGPEYSSASLVRVLLTTGSDPSVASQVGSTGNEQASRILATQKDVILGDAVVGAAAKELGITEDDLRAAVAVTPLQASDVLELVGRSSTASGAQDLANALADSYVAVGKAQGAEQLRNAAASLDPQLDALASQVAQFDPSSKDPLVLSQRAAIQAQYNSLLLQQQTLESRAAAYPGSAFVLNPASLAKGPSSLSPLAGAGLGAVLGLLVGLGVVLFVYVRASRSAVRVAGGDESDGMRKPIDPRATHQVR